MPSEQKIYLIRRNDPCPCGSGLKFKKCCLLKPAGPGGRVTGKFQFEPGSYGGPGGYMPSLACFTEPSPGRKKYRFILANPSHIAGSEDEALAQAASDFSEACRVDDATGSAEEMGCNSLHGVTSASKISSSSSMIHDADAGQPLGTQYRLDAMRHSVLTNKD